MARLINNRTWTPSKKEVEMPILEAIKKMAKLQYRAYKTITQKNGLRVAYYYKPNTLTEYILEASVDEWRQLK